MDYSILELVLCKTLHLSRRPVAIAFCGSPPAGVMKFAGEEPSGCSFWQIAAGGMTFYTLPGDHSNCAMGSHTHNFPVTPERAGEFEKALSQISGSGYLKMEEIPLIPRLKQAPGAIIYSPLGDTPTDPDLVILVARPVQVMILQEAAMHAGIGLQLTPLGRPACFSLATALSRGMVISAGCLGNRVYTDLKEDELYVIVSGRVLQKIADEVQAIEESSSRITEFHRARRKSLRKPLE